MKINDVNVDKIQPIPGYPHFPLLGWKATMIRLAMDPMQFFTNSYDKYGSVCAFDVKDPKQLFIVGNELTRQVLNTSADFEVDAFRESNFDKASSMYRLSYGLMRLNGEKHKTHRKLMQPAFSARQANACFEDMLTVIDSQIEQWQLGEVKDIGEEVTQIISRIAIRSMFGVYEKNQSDRTFELLRQLLSLASNPLSMGLPFNIKGLPFNRMMDTAAQLEALISEIIESKRNSEVDSHDVLTALINARDEDGNGFDDDELIGESYTVLCHESSAAGLSWMFLLLDQHPEVHAKLMQEIEQQLGDESLTIANIKNMPYLDAVVKESLRLFPPSGFGVRYATNDTTLAGYSLSKGTAIYYSAYVNHRLAEVFESPLVFSPQRWLSNNAPSNQDFNSFGFGPHNCMGKHFALLSVKTTLLSILRRFSPRFVTPTRIDRGWRVSLVPKQGLNMTLLATTNTQPAVKLRGNIQQSIDLESSHE